jgi:protein-S-isoprenylcysteine O-methyltransferase Ste14
MNSCAWFSLVYLIFAYGLWFLFPRFILQRFGRIPKIKYITPLYQISYYLFLIVTIFISFEINILFFLGLLFYLSGLGIYISAIYYFSINEWDKPVTRGIYRLFKHPVYLGFTLIMFGIALAGASWVLFVLAFIISYLSFIIAKREEQDCLAQYKDEYRKYLAK